MTCPSTSVVSPRPASSPFDGSWGDLTLQSSDEVQFHCFSQILIAASPVFEGMAVVGTPTLDPPNSANLNRRPIVPLTEDSKTLDALLRFIYPIQKQSQPRSLEDIVPLLEASLKYMMDFPASVMKEELLAFAQTRPMEVWAIGCRLMLEDVARAGAERMLHHATLGSYTNKQRFVPIEEFIRTPDARGVTAADYYRLWTYYCVRGNIEEGFSFTRPLPRQAQDSSSTMACSDIPWDFFLSEIILPDGTCFSSDKTRFPMHAGLLCMSSPVLKKKILASRGRAETGGGDTSRCEIYLEEESPVVAYLLRLCYPGHAPLPTDHHLYLALLKAAKKYGMKRAVDRLHAKWDATAGARPASAYFAALECGLPELARAAALKLSPASRAIYVPEMENHPATHWQGLVDFWAAAQDAVNRVQITLKVAATLRRHTPLWSSGEKQKRDAMYYGYGEGTPLVRGPLWVQGCRDEAVTAVRRRLVARDMPTVEDLVRRSVAPTLREKPWCAACSDVAWDIVRLGSTFQKRMTSALDKVPLIT